MGGGAKQLTILVAEREHEVAAGCHLADGAVFRGVDVQVELADEDAAGDALDEGELDGVW